MKICNVTYLHSKVQPCVVMEMLCTARHGVVKAKRGSVMLGMAEWSKCSVSCDVVQHGIGGVL